MIAIGSDHGGVALKDTIKEYFDENGIEYKDYGTQKDVPADYPDICGNCMRRYSKRRSGLQEYWSAEPV